MKKKHDFDLERKDKHFHIKRTSEDEQISQEFISADNRIVSSLKYVVIFNPVPSALIVFLTAVTTVTSLLVIITLLTFFAVWLEYSVEATIFLSWGLAMTGRLK